MATAPVAQLLSIHIGRLHEGDTEEAAKLFKAACENGFFYLDFRGSIFATMLGAADGVFSLAKDLFNLTEEEKLRYDIDKLGKLKLNGYKPAGRNFGGVNGKKDGFESYTIPGKAHLDSSFARPPLLSNHSPSLTAFSTQIRHVIALLLTSLSSSLKLPPSASLVHLHRDDAPSPDILRMLHYLPQPPHETGPPQAPHTDLGSLTLLFTTTPGLQVLSPSSSEWVFVDPKEGCAIVNIGDDSRSGSVIVAKMTNTASHLEAGLTMLTGGLFHSSLHRVGPPSGRAMEERYSFAYLQRTEDDVKMVALPGIVGATERRAGEVYTSREWLEKKFGMLRRETWREGIEGQRILTGRMGV